MEIRASCQKIIVFILNGKVDFIILNSDSLTLPPHFPTSLKCFDLEKEKLHQSNPTSKQKKVSA